MLPHPVLEIAVASNPIEMLLEIEMVGNELTSIHCGSHSGALGGVPDLLPNPVAAYSVKLAALQSGAMLDRGEKEE